MHGAGDAECQTRNASGRQAGHRDGRLPLPQTVTIPRYTPEPDTVPVTAAILPAPVTGRDESLWSRQKT